MSSSWNAEESCIELTMRVEELNYTIYGLSLIHISEPTRH